MRDTTAKHILVTVVDGVFVSVKVTVDVVVDVTRHQVSEKSTFCVKIGVGTYPEHRQ